MPELPEVEVCRRGLQPELAGERILGAVVRSPRLRLPLPATLGETLAGQQVAAVRRRAHQLRRQPSSAPRSGRTGAPAAGTARPSRVHWR